LTLCNGAIVAGRARVAVVEACASAGGAAWLLAQAERLTGRKADLVVVTHYHADHTGGIGTGGAGAAAAGGPQTLQATSATLELVRADDVRRQRTPDAERTAALEGAGQLSGARVTELELGGRTLRVVPRSGHTASDVTVELDDPSVVIAGDLLWNGMFPNYVDAVPGQLARSVRALVRERETVYVPGHGPVADAAAVRRYLEVLDLVEVAARRAHAEGTPAAEAAKQFVLPASLGEWYLFSPRYYEVALGAWERELHGVTWPEASPRAVAEEPA
ncbi:MAG: MBL fold metallo-hydrolase, partial [Gemmatimonadetes bacterium]|nr:MBL fold metallo-hydrolase [Gemmatimonadota bacterium]